MNDASAPRGLGLAPLLREDRPQHLIEKLAVLQERTAQHAFLHGAEFAQRAVAAPVGYRRARFEPAHVEYLNRKVHHHAPSINEHARAPELRAERKAPFGRLERWFELANLE